MMSRNDDIDYSQVYFDDDLDTIIFFASVEEQDAIETFEEHEHKIGRSGKQLISLLHVKQSFAAHGLDDFCLLSGLKVLQIHIRDAHRRILLQTLITKVFRRLYLQKWLRPNKWKGTKLFLEIRTCPELCSSY